MKKLSEMFEFSHESVRSMRQEFKVQFTSQSAAKWKTI